MTTIPSDVDLQLKNRVIQRISFASCYVYSPVGTDIVCQRSRLLRELLKEGNTHFILKYAVRVHQQVGGHSLLGGFLGAGDTLVPVPGCTPLKAGHRWVSAILADSFVSEGLGGAVWSGLHRHYSVRKSATAPVGERPSVGLHYDSFSIENPLVPPESIVLIDDVVTKGRTLLAAASRLHEAFPTARIRAFALLRTMGLVSGVKRLLEPCMGEIRWRHGDAYRSP
jgi:hypothetical protein